MTGSCLCGAVTFTATLEAPHIEACHCTTCRKWGGGPAFASTVTSLDLPEDAPIAYFASSDHAERGFCTVCGTHLIWRMKDGSFVTIFAGSLDNADDLPLTGEIYVDEQPATYAFANDTRRMTGAEVIAAFSTPSEDT